MLADSLIAKTGCIRIFRAFLRACKVLRLWCSSYQSQCPVKVSLHNLILERVEEGYKF